MASLTILHMKNRLLNNWTLPRILRVIIGMIIIGEAIFRADMVTGLAGTIFTAMGVFDVGCCGAGGCYTPLKKTAAVSEDINYEEIK